jgi:two-component system response regulator AtoC
MDKSILIVDDEPSIRKAMSMILKTDYNILTAESGSDAFSKLDSHLPDLILMDIGLPDINGIDLLRKIKSEHPEITIVMITAVDKISTVVKALKLGAYDYLVKPIESAELTLTVKNAIENQTLKDKIRLIQQPSVRRYKFDMISHSPQIKKLLNTAEKLTASLSTPVLLVGESGAGKGVLAKSIHYGYTETPGPFVTVNCTAIPDDLFESELFGYERGAFTGAKSGGSKGRFEESASGTIFLDEIGSISLSIQSKLLGVLEDRVFYRVGGNRPIKVSSRIVAATNVNLEEAVAEGKFRKDLYYRLNVVRLKLPPLRERQDDIMPLAEYFMKLYSGNMGKKFDRVSKDAKQLLLNYQWPGNVRELRNTLERIILLEEGDTLCPDHLGFMNSVKTLREPLEMNISGSNMIYEDVIKSLLSNALDKSRGNVIEAANLLQIAPHKMRYRIKRYGLKT